MAVTIHTLTSSISDYDLEKDKYSWRLGQNPDFSKLNPATEDGVFFYSDQRKMVIRMPQSFYHCLHDFMGTIFHIYELDPEVLFIIDTSMSERNPISAKFSKFCFEVLDYYNIKYEKVDLYGVSIVNLNNFYIRKYRMLDNDASNNVIKYFMPFIKNKDIEPFRKTFVSRRLATVVKQKYYGDVLGSRLSRNTYQRLDDEKKLEDFFRSQGFEVICPEDFDSFEDQVNYFYEVKTIVSITGGGLTNMIFMQNGGNVIELMSTLITNQSMGTKTPNGLEEGQHHFYHSIAFRKNFTYFGIPNIDAKCDTLVERIEKDGILKMLEGR